MSFLNAILLLGAAAFAIPLIIHLLNKRRVTRVAWGAMHLLQEAMRQRKRNLKLEQLLLLLVRVSIPILLALCLARPVFSLLRSLPGLQKNSLVVVLDNSFSMRAPVGNSTLREEARKELRQILDKLPRGSDVSVILAGAPARVLQSDPTTALDLLMTQLNQEPGMGGPVPLNDALQLAVAESSRMGTAAREILLISDFQEGDWRAVADGAPLPALSALAQTEAKPLVTFFRLRSELQENLAVVSVEPSAFVIAREQTIALKTRIQNHGERSYEDVAVHLEADGVRARTTRVSIAANAETVLTLTHAFADAGDHSLTIRVEGDSLLEDNAFSLVVPVREQVNTLLLQGEAGSGPLTGSTDFLEIALVPHQSAEVSLKDVIKTTTTDTKRLTDKTFENQEVVVMSNVPRLYGNALNVLRKHVEGGAGLLIFMGPACEEKWYQEELYAQGKGLLPALPRGFGHTDAGQPPARILSQRYTHPATAYFNDARGMKLQDAAFTHWQKLELGDGGARPILSLDRGDALIVEKTFGQGRVMVVSSTATAQWNNFPLQPAFVPLMQRLVTYLATQNTAPQFQLCGETLRCSLSKADAGRPYVLTDPQHALHEVTADTEKDGRVLLNYRNTWQPGVYQVKEKDARSVTPPRLFAFNLNPAESRLQTLPPEKSREVAQRLEAGYAETQDEYARLDRSRRHGAEIWQPLLLLLLGFLYVEVFLQQRISKA